MFLCPGLAPASRNGPSRFRTVGALPLVALMVHHSLVNKVGMRRGSEYHIAHLYLPYHDTLYIAHGNLHI